MIALGFDTSNYTTSVAAFDGENGENCSRLLDVKPGELGLRQSDALFAHVKRLPELTDRLFRNYKRDEIKVIGVSTRPRDVEGSYMPCFLAGASQAEGAWRGARCSGLHFLPSAGTYRSLSLVFRTDGADESTAPCMAPFRRDNRAPVGYAGWEKTYPYKSSEAQRTFLPAN
jgi:hypothetical protein